MTTASATGCDNDKSDLQFAGIFEGTEPFRPWSVNEADAAPPKPKYSTTVKRDCSGSARMELRKSDPLEASSYRSELKVVRDTANGGVKVPSGTSAIGSYGSEVWMGWSIYVPGDFVFETASGEQETVIQAWSSCGRSPPWEVQIDKGTFEVISRTGSKGSLKTTVAGTRPITKGAWHDFVLHIKWKGNDTGVLEMWMNGTKFISRQNTPTIWSDCTSINFLKMGIYKWSWKAPTSSKVSTRVLYFDAVRITDGQHGSYSVVAPR
jgi:hypothetical protein